MGSVRFVRPLAVHCRRGADDVTAQVTASHTAQLAQLAPDSSIPHDAVTEEYEERTRAALDAVDVALNQIRFAPAVEEDAGQDDWSDFDDSNVRAWLHSTQLALEPGMEAVQVCLAMRCLVVTCCSQWYQTSSASISVPTDDFWKTDSSFKWDEEPEAESPSEPAEDFWNTDTSFKWDEEPEVEASGPLAFIDAFEPRVMDDDSLSVLDDAAVGPWDSVSERDLDLDDDDYSSFDDSLQEVPHGYSGDDTSTLFHSDPLDALKERLVSSMPAKLASFGIGIGSPRAADMFAARPALLAGF